MSIRIIALYILVIGLSIYAWKDWFKSLCGLILLMAFISHGDMPTKLFGIQGLNPWNFLFAMIVIAWAANRRSQGLLWDLPRHIAVLLLLYLAVIIMGVLRAIFDRSYLEGYYLSSLISEELINTIKWVLPALLLFDGCRTRRQVIMALVCLLVMYTLMAMQVVRCMPPEAVISDSGLIDRARGRLDEQVGYAATDLSVVLAGACWGMLAAMPLIRKRRYQIMTLFTAAIVAFGMALTGGRGGYLAWGATGFVMCLMKWRRYLLLAPVAVILLPIVLPGATSRMLAGFGVTDVAGRNTIDEDELASGRLMIWPYVIDEIVESPLVGHGRLAMKRTGLYNRIETEHPGTGAPHPHNMYLETFLDNGMVGSIPILWLFGLMVVYSARLFRSNNRLYSAVGGLSLALISTSLFAGLTGQHVYPQEHTLGIWAAFFLSLRVYVEEKRTQMIDIGAEAAWSNPPYGQQQVPAVSAYSRPDGRRSIRSTSYE
jgi:O-antigen ligase